MRANADVLPTGLTQKKETFHFSWALQCQKILFSLNCFILLG